MSAAFFSVCVWEEPEELQMSLLFCLSCVFGSRPRVHQVVFIEPGINMHCYGRDVQKILATSVPSVALLTLAVSLGSSGGLHGYHTVRDVRCDYFICLGGSGASPSNRPGIAAAGSYPAQEYRILTLVAELCASQALVRFAEAHGSISGGAPGWSTAGAHGGRGMRRGSV